MNMLEVHADALSRSNTAYHEFLLYYRNDAPLVYGFVEGRDDPVFYKGLIDQFLADGWSVKLIVAGDRKRVIELLGYMDWARFPQKRICFFVDRDLSDYLGESFPNFTNLYLTDGYSVENWVVNEATLDRTLEEVIGVQGTSPEEGGKIHAAFKASFDTFKSAMLPVMAQILLWRRANGSPCLDNIRLKEWFTFENGKLEPTNVYTTDSSRLESAAAWCKLTSSAEADVATTVTELLAKREAGLIIRGKYVLWFFVQCVLSIRDGIGHFCGKYKTKQPKMRIALGPENAIVVLANRVRAPRSLRDFVISNYVAYIQGIPG